MSIWPQSAVGYGLLGSDDLSIGFDSILGLQSIFNGLVISAGDSENITTIAGDPITTIAGDPITVI